MKHDAVKNIRNSAANHALVTSGFVFVFQLSAQCVSAIINFLLSLSGESDISSYKFTKIKFQADLD